jgi:hypothetical protein
LIRRAVSAIVPDPFKRLIDRLRMRRFLALSGPAASAYVAASGLQVSGGPFAGMQYPSGLERTNGALVAKLLGAYECELHSVVEELVHSDAAHVIDVGCAEGYYAVGFARAMPATTVHAYDIDGRARAACAELAALNSVGQRVVVREACTPADLAEFPARGVVLFCDCEGYERTLLDPDAAAVLAHWLILVELHDFIDPTITATIQSRFAGTHTVELIGGEERDPDRYPQLGSFSARERSALLNEYRPELMSWAVLRPAP